jgi:hypothetical protein
MYYVITDGWPNDGDGASLLARWLGLDPHAADTLRHFTVVYNILYMCQIIIFCPNFLLHNKSLILI